MVGRKCASLMILGGVVLFVLVALPLSWAQPKPDGERPGGEKKGLILATDAAWPGYTLYAPLRSNSTYLVDMRGKLVHEWKSDATPGQSVYLLEDGSLLRTQEARSEHPFEGGGIGGRVVRLAADASVLWEFEYANDAHCLHHDIEPLPNGNILMIAWERKTRADVLAAGRDPSLQTSDEFWPDHVIEVEPTGTSGGRIVWEWHVWDHLVQEYDRAKTNYGEVAGHPELVDLNYRNGGPRESPEEIERLEALGYIGGGDDDEDDAPDDRRRGPGGPGGPGGGADWNHINSVAYNADLDQIVLSVHNFSEIWVVDHGTTTAQAAGHTGGRRGHGGDLLYRWGNPQAYGAGSSRDQQLFAQHDARWIPAGLPGAGHLLMFNNGMGRRDGQYSSIDEIVPPLRADGTYATASAFEPKQAHWTYVAEDRDEFFSSHISGAQRLPNGNTLICSGEQGRLFEVDAAGKTVWEYRNPFGGDARPRHGPPPGMRPPGFRGDGPPPRGEGGRPPRRGDGPPPMGDGRRPPFPPRGDPGGPGRPRGPGGDDRSAVFRATRYGEDYAGVNALLEQIHLFNLKAELAQQAVAALGQQRAGFPLGIGPRLRPALGADAAGQLVRRQESFVADAGQIGFDRRPGVAQGPQRSVPAGCSRASRQMRSACPISAFGYAGGSSPVGPQSAARLS